MSPFAKLRAFHEAFDLPHPVSPGLPDAGQRDLRRKLLTEEFHEYLDAEAQDDLVEIAKELADVIYIAYGTAVAYGIPMDAVFDEVHRSNMAKLGPDGKVIRREDGKVLKPQGWTKPDIAALVAPARSAHG